MAKKLKVKIRTFPPNGVQKILFKNMQGQWVNLGPIFQASFTSSLGNAASAAGKAIFTATQKKGKIRMPKFRKQRTPKVKVPKPAKIPRPKTKNLRMVLKGLLTVSQANRIASLAYALQWYDQALPYLVQKGQLDAKAKKLLEIAVKCRKQGIGTSVDNEKEAGFLMALRQYEKACTFCKPPSVDKYYDTFNAKKAQLEAKQQRMENKFGNVTAILQKAIGDRVKLQVADAQKPFQYDPGLTSVSYNRESAKALAVKFRQEGLLAVFADQMDILAQHAALQPDGSGGWSYDPARHVTIVGEMLQSFIKFARTGDAPKKLVRTGVLREPKVKQPAQPGQPAAARAPRVSTKGPRYLGFLVPGTAIAMVYERLMDEKEHELNEVIAGLTTSDPVGRVKQLGRYGQQKQVLDLTINGQKVSIKHKPGVTPGSKS